MISRKISKVEINFEFSDFELILGNDKQLKGISKSLSLYYPILNKEITNVSLRIYENTEITDTNGAYIVYKEGGCIPGNPKVDSRGIIAYRYSSLLDALSVSAAENSKILRWGLEDFLYYVWDSKSGKVVDSEYIKPYIERSKQARATVVNNNKIKENNMSGLEKQILMGAIKEIVKEEVSKLITFSDFGYGYSGEDDIDKVAFRCEKVSEYIRNFTSSELKSLDKKIVDAIDTLYTAWRSK